MTDILQKAIAKRAHLLGGNTDAIRVFDGIPDDCPRAGIDAYAGSLVVATQGEKMPDVLIEPLKKYPGSVYWKRLSQSQKESPAHFSGPEKLEPFVAKEGGVRYEISFHAGYSQGIFLDQRDNRSWVREMLDSGDKLLNTFAYTGAFSVCASLAGATSTTLDLSQPYLDWGKRNFHLNGLDPSEHYWCKGDTFHWLERFAKQGRKFQGIILDPPTFSRDHKGKVFRVEKDYARLVSLAQACLEKGGWILATTNCRKLSDEDFSHLVTSGCSRKYQSQVIPMPEEYCDVPFLKTVRLRF